MEIFISIREYVKNMSKYLDLAGLQQYNDKIKSYVDSNFITYRLGFNVVLNTSTGKLKVFEILPTLTDNFGYGYRLPGEFTNGLNNAIKFTMENKASLIIQLNYNDDIIEFIPDIYLYQYQDVVSQEDVEQEDPGDEEGQISISNIIELTANDIYFRLYNDVLYTFKFRYNIDGESIIKLELELLDKDTPISANEIDALFN